MAIDRRLLDILCCPVSRVPVRPLFSGELALVNRAIAEGGVLDVSDRPVSAPFAEALITTDRRVIYRVEDGIPVMLADEGVGTTQFTDFPG